MDGTAEQVKERFQRFAEMECKDYSRVYYLLAHSIAVNDELTAFIAMPDQQPFNYGSRTLRQSGVET